jgi:hypothetical protein
MRKAVFVILIFISTMPVIAQDSSSVSLKGKAFDKNNPDKRLEDLMIINLRTSHGTFGMADGTFHVEIQKDDTFLIASTGYEYRKYCFKDSVYRNEYFINVPLIKLNVTLKEVQVFSARDLESIYSDIQKLGYNKDDFEISGVNALNSPITFLYQEFSKFERLRRHNAERINNERRKDLLRQLLANYVSHDIINLDDFEFDDFIEFANVPEEFMKSATQYDFCIYIKRKFELYAMMKN